MPYRLPMKFGSSLRVSEIEGEPIFILEGIDDSKTIQHNLRYDLHNHSHPSSLAPHLPLERPDRQPPCSGLVELGCLCDRRLFRVAGVPAQEKDITYFIIISYKLFLLSASEFS